MSNCTTEIYTNCEAKLNFIKSCIEILNTSDAFKENIVQRTNCMEVKLNEINDLTTQNFKIRESLKNSIEELEVKRKRLEYLQDLLPRNSYENTENSECNSAAYSYSDSGSRYEALSPNLQYLDVPAIVPKIALFQEDLIPAIRLMESTEFRAIPQYMRGRLHVDVLNNFIHLMNEALICKYSLLKLKKSQVPKDKVKIYCEYKKLEASVDKNVRFITPSDLGMKMVDKQTNNYLAMLRHTKRIKEMRKDGLLRICIV